MDYSSMRICSLPVLVGVALKSAFTVGVPVEGLACSLSERSRHMRHSSLGGAFDSARNMSGTKLLHCYGIAYLLPETHAATTRHDQYRRGGVSRGCPAGTLGGRASRVFWDRQYHQVTRITRTSSSQRTSRTASFSIGRTLMVDLYVHYR
jgi:hypothetical protein